MRYTYLYGRAGAGHSGRLALQARDIVAFDSAGSAPFVPCCKLARCARPQDASFSRGRCAGVGG
eukprot:5184211-Pleurochrysis_carterae.AAC.2